MNRSYSFMLSVLVLSGSLVAAVQSHAVVQGPVPVSPGESGWMMTIDTPCPAERGAGVAEAGSYEIAVYDLYDKEVGQLGSVLDPGTIIRHKVVPGTATSWTPAESDCLPGSGLSSIRVGKFSFIG